MTPEEEQAAARSEAARALGSIRSPRKTATSRANLAPVNAARQVKPCTCGRTDGTHPARCPVGARERRKRQRAEAGTAAGHLLREEETNGNGDCND